MSQRAILFDLDGTLVDSVPDLAAALATLLAERGRPPLGIAAVTEMVGDGAAKLVERALAASGEGEAPLGPALDRFVALYEANATRFTRVYEGVPEVLGALADAGWRLALCTNKLERATRAVIEALGLAPRFAIVLGGDSLPTRKPDPGPLLAALDGLGVAPSRAAMVGDHANDILAARRAGMASIFARYGYGAATLGSLLPDAAIDRFSQLFGALDQVFNT